MLNVVSGLLAGGASADLGQYESIQSYTVGSGGQAYIEFTSIPQTYKHLEIRGISRGATSDDAVMTFNGDTSSSYRWHILEGNGSSAYASNSGGSASSLFYFARTPNGSTAGANIFNATVLTILDYSSTSKNKVFRALGGTDYNGSGTVTQWSGLFAKTDAVTSIKIAIQSGNLAEFSSFALYGIKG